MPKIPPVQVSLYILFLTKYLGLVLVNQKNGHYCYDKSQKPHLPRRIEFTAHGSTKKEIPGIYVLKVLKQFDLTWEKFLEICKDL
jgi:predicted RNA binding protein YcfA (HicA-like mRNA interferase family)